VGGIVGGVIGGLALIACVAVLVIFIPRRKVGQQEDVYELSHGNVHEDKDRGAPNTEPVVEQSERYGTAHI
jgi:hypothetical protein